MMRKIFLIHVKNPIDFLGRLITHIEGDAFMSMEGDLSRCSLEEFEGFGAEPIPPLKKITLAASGRHDFAVISINEANKKRLIESLLPRIGIRANVWHIEIARNGIKIFGSYDNFHPECVWLDQSLGEEMVKTMLNEKVILGFEAKEADV
jgi:hypothetical protein